MRTRPRVNLARTAAVCLLTSLAFALSSTASATLDRSAGRPPLQASAAATRDGLIAYSIKTGIHVIRPDGTGLRVLIPWRTRSCGRGCTTWLGPRHPRWSPDGRRITYHVEKYTVRKHAVEDSSARTVYVANANGSHRERLGRGHDPDWSPNGSEVVYLRNDATYPDPDWPGHRLGYPDDYGPMRAVNPRTGDARNWPTLGG